MKKRAKSPKSENPDTGQVFDSMRAAATGMAVEMRILKAAKAAGCPAFRGGRIYANELRAWLLENPSVAKAKDTTWKTKIEKERHRKLRLENDQTEDTLISRAWMAERIHLVFGKIQAYRQKSEAEHPLNFAAAAGDVTLCRAEMRKIWDEIMFYIQSLSVDFREKGKEPNE